MRIEEKRNMKLLEITNKRNSQKQLTENENNIIIQAEIFMRLKSFQDKYQLGDQQNITNAYEKLVELVDNEIYAEEKETEQ